MRFLSNQFLIFACLGAYLLTSILSPHAVGSMTGDNERAWMLQLAYFSNLQNALNYKQQLNDAGFEVETVAAGTPDKQRYYVIAKWADNPEAFEQLRNRIDDAMGNRGIVVKNPFLLQARTVADASDEAVFDQPHSRYLLAQTDSISPMSGESAASATATTYENGLFRTAQEQMDSMPGITAAGLQIVPTIGLSLGYDDNITQSRAFQSNSFFYIISPAVQVELPSDHSILVLTAAMEIIRYTDSEIDNREPWYLRADWAWDPSSRQDFHLFAQYGEGADPRGVGRRQGDIGLLPLPLDEWQRIQFGGIWRYGAIGARGKLELRAGGSLLEYTNNRSGINNTGGTRLLDRDWWYMGATFFWRVAPKTSLLADIVYTDIDYTLANTDSEETAWMLGVNWDATARTSGRISYGNQKKDFADPELIGYDGPTWLASVSWRPLTYSVFTLTATRRTQEPDGNAEFVLRQDISLAWNHDWASRLSTVVDVGYGEDDYRPNVRTDDLLYWSAGVRYTFSPHFRFGASIKSYDRNSDEAEFSYKRKIFLLTMEASL